MAYQEYRHLNLLKVFRAKFPNRPDKADDFTNFPYPRVFFATDFPAVGSEKSLVSSLVNHVNDYELKMFLVKIIIRN